VATIRVSPWCAPCGPRRITLTLHDGAATRLATRWALAGTGESSKTRSRRLVLVLARLYRADVPGVCLTVLYEGWLQPVMILTALPLAFGWAFLCAVLVFGRDR